MPYELVPVNAVDTDIDSSASISKRVDEKVIFLIAILSGNLVEENNSCL